MKAGFSLNTEHERLLIYVPHSDGEYWLVNKMVQFRSNGVGIPVPAASWWHKEVA